MIYLITYDKNTVLKDYTPLYKAIKESGDTWWHHMNNTWLINTHLSASEIYNNLREHLNVADRLLVVKIHRPSDCQGWLNKKAWEWIAKQDFPYPTV